MTELTYISTTEINNYDNITDLQVIIIKTLAKWFPNDNDFNEKHTNEWLCHNIDNVYLLHSNGFQFKLSITNENVYKLVMYAEGRFRSHGSSLDFFERVFNCLEYQINNPKTFINTMMDANADFMLQEDNFTDLKNEKNEENKIITKSTTMTAVESAEENENCKPISYYKKTGFIPSYGFNSGKKTIFEDDNDF